MDIQDIVTIAIAGLTFFAAIARITPNKHDDKIVDALIKVVNVLGINPKGLKEGNDKPKSTD